MDDLKWLNDDEKKSGDYTPAKKFKDEDDEEINKLKQSNEKRTIDNVNKKINDWYRFLTLCSFITASFWYSLS